MRRVIPVLPVLIILFAVSDGCKSTSSVSPAYNLYGEWVLNPEKTIAIKLASQNVDLSKLDPSVKKGLLEDFHFMFRLALSRRGTWESTYSDHRKKDFGKGSFRIIKQKQNRIEIVTVEQTPSGEVPGRMVFEFLSENQVKISLGEEGNLVLVVDRRE